LPVFRAVKAMIYSSELYI